MRTRTPVINPEPPPKTEYDRPSKSQRKRDVTALQELGRELSELSKAQLGELELPEKLHQALLDYQTITAHEGKRRQYQYIGKLMRDVDAEPLREALDRFTGDSKAEVGDMHLAERWRERLLSEEGVLGEFANTYPGTDLQQLRVLVRNAKKERETTKPPRDFRKLYQLIREQIDARRKAAAPAAPAAEDDEEGE
jgi:ribosome-associated protein